MSEGTAETPPPISAPISQSVPPSQREMFGSRPDVSHPRGRILPLLGRDQPRSRRVLRVLWRLGQGMYYHDVFQVAPAMAFHFFLSLLPLLVFVGYILGRIAEQAGVDAILGLFLDNLPRATEGVIKAQVAQLAGASSFGPLALVGFFWIAAGGIHGLMDALERVVGAAPRPWWRKRVLALGWVVCTLVAFAIASYANLEWDNVKAYPTSGALATVRFHMVRTGGERLLGVLASVGIAVLGLGAFYRFAVTHSRRVRRRVWPGALVAVILWIVVSWGFGIYIQSLTNYTVYYGSLAAVAVLLLWLWLISIAMLVGAELNSQLEGLRDALLDG